MQNIKSNITNIIVNLIQSDINLSDYELELRFGKLDYREKFNPNIGNKIFFDIFNSLKGEIVENAFINDKIYECGMKRRIKKVDKLMFEVKNFHVHNKDEEVITHYIKKEKINQYTYDYVRLSFNKEETLQHIGDNNLKIERQKYRVSKMFSNIFRFDFTKLQNQNDYGIEIEILLSKIKDIESFNKEYNKLEQFLKPYIVSFEDILFHNINPPQPHTMNYSDLFMICSSNYTVTDKADGIRTFLKIYNNNASLINPKTKQVIRDLGKCELKNTLIDGEYVNNRFYAFDIMFYDNNDVRNLILTERLKILKNHIPNIKVGLYINIKKFYDTDIFNNAKKILNGNHPYKIDGLIFTPINEKYNCKEMPIFKWKKRQTIDVRVYYNAKEDFTYFIFGKKYGRINEWSKPYYEKKYMRTRNPRVRKMANMIYNQEYDDLRRKKIHFGKYKLFNSKLFNTPFLGKHGPPNQDPYTYKKLNRNIDVILDKYDIIEYEYREGVWFPLRKRTFDKDEANAIKTIDSILKVIEQDITIDKMIDFSKKYTITETMNTVYNTVAQDKAFKRDNWRKFHNYAKRRTIINASNSCVGGSYLDLACGQGGDIKKYINLGYKNILAIDTSEVELYGKNGYVHRLCDNGFIDKGLYFEKNGIKVTVVCGDMSLPIRNGEFLRHKNDMNKLNDFFTRVDKFDVISTMFSIHYMFAIHKDGKWINDTKKTEDFFNNIIDLLKPDGKFIGTYLNINHDNDMVFKNHGIPFYEIKHKDDHIEVQNNAWGWGNVLTEIKIDEQLMDIWFEDSGFIAIKNESFENIYQMFKNNEAITLSEDEKKLGFLNNYFIVVRSPQVINKSITI